MQDWSLAEASDAVNADYTSYAGHLFLANSFNALQDPKEINLRYETPAFAEYLIANLLAPPGTGLLSPTISQMQYSRLLERDGFGVTSLTEYLSNGAWNQSGAQYGTFGGTSYSLEGAYSWDPGFRPNNDFESRTLSFNLRQQVGNRDTVFAQVTSYDATAGDVAQSYGPVSAPSMAERTAEKQEAGLIMGGRHEWNAEHETIVLFARIPDSYKVTNEIGNAVIDARQTENQNADFIPKAGGLDYNRSVLLYSGELQHLWRTDDGLHFTLVGARGQVGDEHVTATYYPQDALFFDSPPLAQANSEGFDRASVYGYHTWRLSDRVSIIGGVSYDHVGFPVNLNLPPISEGRRSVGKVSPKAGLVISPWTGGRVRAAYSQSQAGAGLDQSIQLEPSQLAGFVQSFRSLIPESIVGANPGAHFETVGAAFEQSLPSRTYLGASGTVSQSTLTRTAGSFDLDASSSSVPVPTLIDEQLQFREDRLVLFANQRIFEPVSLGARYTLTKVHLDVSVPDVPQIGDSQYSKSVLQQLTLFGIFNHPSGFYQRTEGLWNHQLNHFVLGPDIFGNYLPSSKSEDFWQINLLAGFRFPRRRAEVELGLLNIANQGYELNPLTAFDELPHRRTFVARLRLNF